MITIYACNTDYDKNMVLMSSGYLESSVIIVIWDDRVQILAKFADTNSDEC